MILFHTWGNCLRMFPFQPSLLQTFVVLVLCLLAVQRGASHFHHHLASESRVIAVYTILCQELPASPLSKPFSVAVLLYYHF